MRVVFDTNTLVSALLFELSIPAQAFFAAMDTGEILLSATLVNEVNAVLQRKKFKKYISTEQREEFLIALVQWGRLVEITETVAGQRRRAGDCYGGFGFAGLESIQNDTNPHSARLFIGQRIKS